MRVSKKIKRSMAGGASQPPAMLLLIRPAPNSEEDCPLIRLSESPADRPGPPPDGFASQKDFLAAIHPQDLAGWVAARELTLKVGNADCTYRLRSARGRFERWHEWLVRLGDNEVEGQIASALIPVRRMPLRRELSRAAWERLQGFVAGFDFAAPRPARNSATASSDVDRMRLQHVLNHATDGFWDWDLATDEVYYSPRWKGLLGYEDGELPNHLDTWKRLVHPADQERALKVAADYFAGLIPAYKAEFQMRHKTGRWLYVLARGVLVRDAAGKPARLMGTHLDITSRRQAELELREANDKLEQRVSEAVRSSQAASLALQQSEERFRLAMASASQGFYDLNVQTGECVVSPEYARMLGYEPEGFVETNADWIERLHPDDREAVATAYRDYLAGRRPVYAVEFRQRTKSGDWKWILSRGKIVAHSPDGQPLRMLGTHTDITDRVQAERSRDEQRHLLRSVIDSCADMVFVKDLELRTVLCNTAFAAALGKRPEETYGRTDIENGWSPELVKGDPARNIRGFEADDRLALAGQIVSNPCDPANVRGEIRYFDTIKLPLRNAAGEIIGLLAVCRDITDRRRMEIALRESEAKYRRLIETMRDAFVSVDMTGRILECNPAYEAMLGYATAELLQKTYLELTPERWHALEARILQEEILPQGFSGVYEKEYRRADGTVFPVELRTVLVRDAAGEPVMMWAVVRDITARKQAEAALRDLNANLEQLVIKRTESLRLSEQRFKALAAAALEGLMISQHGVILDCNERLAAMLGCRRESLVGTSALRFLADSYRDAISRCVIAGEEVHAEVQWVRVDGRVIEVEMHCTSPEGPNGLRLTAVRDITQRKAIEQMQREIASQWEALTRYQRSAELAEVSAGIIHQIGQPLTAAINNLGAAATLLNQLPGAADPVKEAMQDAESSLRQVRLTMERLRALSHPERSATQPTDLNSLVLEVLRLVDSEAAAKQVALQHQPHAAPLEVMADSVQLSQAVLNIVRNALDAAASNPAAQARVVVSTQGEGAKAIILVSDSGPGIPAEIFPRLFEPFFTTKPDGMGVGLSLTRRIARSHGGTIEAYNNGDGSGATFCLRFPLRMG